MNVNEYYHFRNFGGGVHHLVDPVFPGIRYGAAALCGRRCNIREPIFYLKVPNHERECLTCLAKAERIRAEQLARDVTEKKVQRVLELEGLRPQYTHKKSGPRAAPHISAEAHNEYVTPMSVIIKNLKENQQCLIQQVAGAKVEIEERVREITHLKFAQRWALNARRLSNEAVDEANKTLIRLHAKIRRQATALDELQAVRAKEKKGLFSFVPDKKPDTSRMTDIQFLKESNAYLRGVLQERDARIMRQKRNGRLLDKRINELEEERLHRGNGVEVKPKPPLTPFQRGETCRSCSQIATHIHSDDGSLWCDACWEEL